MPVHYYVMVQRMEVMHYNLAIDASTHNMPHHFENSCAISDYTCYLLPGIGDIPAFNTAH